MSAERHAQEELAHIERMIAELKRAGGGGGRNRPMRNPVMRIEYWQRRIDALISASTNEPLRRDAAALRERLADAFAASANNATGSTGEPTAEVSSKR